MPEILRARLARLESSRSCLGAMEECLVRHGIPVAVCTDRHATFVTHARGGARGESRVERVFQELGTGTSCRCSRSLAGARNACTAQRRLLSGRRTRWWACRSRTKRRRWRWRTPSWAVGLRATTGITVPPADAHVSLMLDAAECRQVFSIRVGCHRSADLRGRVGVTRSRSRGQHASRQTAWLHRTEQGHGVADDERLSVVGWWVAPASSR